jgi:Tfp pilus assembly protein PilW
MSARGFTLIEAMFAMAVTLTVTAAVLMIVSPSEERLMPSTETADMQQRLRVASETLYKDLVMAGAGAYLGTQAGPLSAYFASVFPSRVGASSEDPPGTFKPDTVTIVYVPSTASQATLTSPVIGSTSTITVSEDSTCPPGKPLCGFTTGMTVLVFDAAGDFDLATITGVVGSSGLLHINRPNMSTAYPAGAKIVEAVQKTYYLKVNEVAKTYQLMMDDGTTSSDVPVVDNVVALTLDYYGDPIPPVLKERTSDPGGPAATYGPVPPPLDAQIPGGGYPPGENCVFMVDPDTNQQVSRLPTLGDESPGLVKLTSSELTDGPWCPDASNPNRWDADLLRIRMIGVTVRVQSAMEGLRGPAGALFSHAGTATSVRRWVPDQEIRFQVSPRNLNLGR